MCLQKFSPSLQIFQNLPLDSYLHVHPEIPPSSLQIFQNLPLDSYLSYLHVLAEISPPPVCRFSKFMPLDRYLHVLAEIPSWGADFPKSATGQLPKLPTCAYRNSPQFADFPKSANGQIPTCACRNYPPARVQIFQNLPLDSYLSYLHVLAEIPPSLQIFQNLPLDSYLSYQHVLAEIPPQFADFPKSATGQIPTCACRNPPQWGADFPKSSTGQLPKLPTCACRNSAPSLQIFQNLPLDS